MVETIDYKTKIITFKPDQGGNVLRLSWYWGTTFLADGKHAKPDALKIGTQVKIEYFKPILGRDYLSQIEWTSNTAHLAR